MGKNPWLNRMIFELGGGTEFFLEIDGLRNPNGSSKIYVDDFQSSDRFYDVPTALIRSLNLPLDLSGLPQNHFIVSRQLDWFSARFLINYVSGMTFSRIILKGESSGLESVNPGGRVRSRMVGHKIRPIKTFMKCKVEQLNVTPERNTEHIVFVCDFSI